MSFLTNTTSRRLAFCLVGLWALLFLPNLRTNPNWYSDEGEVMEMAWTVAHGHPRVGPTNNDFLFPPPYPPVHLLITGVALRLFGQDILVARLVSAVTALAGALVLFWIGMRIRDSRFGFLCAAAFLVYPETVINYRWVRPHPLAGVLALASAGFAVKYLQEKRWQDVLWAGLLCSVAVGTHYFVYPLTVALFLTVLFVNRRHVPTVVGGLALYPVLFLIWYLASQPGGLAQLVSHVQLLGGQAAEASGSMVNELTRIYRNIATFCLLTPTQMRNGAVGVDIWLVLAAAGMLLFPVQTLRKWLLFWTLALMYAVFKKLNNVPVFFYPATIFLPMLAIGFAGAVERVSDWSRQRLAGKSFPPRLITYLLPGVVLGFFGMVSLGAAWGHFRTKVDPWTIHSPADAEAAMRYVNAHTTEQDFVLIPKHLYWLVNHARSASLADSVAYNGQTNGIANIVIPQDCFWFDAHWQNAKYLVLAYGRSFDGSPYGFDAVYTLGFEGMRQIVQEIQRQNWPMVFQQGEFMVLANPRFVGK